MLGITTVVYNKLDFVKRTVEAVLENTKKPYCYILVYNDSPYKNVHDYICELQRENDYLMFVFNKRNAGVTKAYNQGLSELIKANHSLTYFAKVDDDTIIQTKNWNEKMIQAFEDFPKLGVLSANIDSGKQVGRYKELKKNKTTLEVFEAPSVGGGCTIYPMELFKTIGFFRDFGYYGVEDGEFAIRARRENYITAYLKDVHCKHLGRTDESDKYFDTWKLLYWNGKTELDYPTWLKETHNIRPGE